MKKKMLLSALCLSVLALTGCSQWTARNFGGDYEVELPKGEKLVNATWKEDSLWYLTEPMEENYVPTEYKFQADSVFGVFEGTVTITESK